MDYGERMSILLENISNLTRMSERLDDGFIGKVDSLVERLNEIDTDSVEKIISAVEKIDKNRRDVLLVENGLQDIKRVVEMQNQVANVSDARDSIGLVAGKIEDIEAVAEDLTYVRASTLMEPMIKEVLNLSTKIDLVLDMEEKIDYFIDEIKRSRGIIENMDDLALRASNSAILAVNMVNKINVAERRIDEKLKRVEEIEKTIKGFHATVDHLDADQEPTHVYDHDKNVLTIGIPRGKTGPRGNYKGDRGEAGRDGKNYEVMHMGKISERMKYSNATMGTSFLSLDEIPTMIYFRKSNQFNDWTEGQPFGVSNGGYSDDDKGIDIIDGINIDELTTHILRNMESRKNG